MLKFLIALLLLSQLVDAFKLQLSRHEPTHEDLIKARLARKTRSQAQRQRFGRSNAASKSRLDDFQDFLYTVNISIGEPEQKPFRLLVDTASAFTWIPDITFDSDYDDEPSKVCETKHCFNSSKSTSYIKDGRRYGPSFDPNSISGFLGIDTVRIGDEDLDQLVIKNVTFGQTTHMAQMFYDPRFDGILGLAFQSIAIDDVEPIFQTALKEKVIDKSIFTIWIQSKGEKADNQVGGQLTFGDLDPEHCSNDIVYVPLSSKTYFEFKIDGYALNDGVKVSGKWQAVSDLGTSFIFVPDKIIKVIVETLNAKYNSQYDLYSVDCNVKFNFSLIVGEKTLTIDEKVTVVSVDETNTCYLGLEAWTDFGIDFILGDVFAREWCQIYDTSGQIGFAKSLKN